MGTRTGSHQLSGGLFVSGRPEQQLKERQPTMSSRAVIYTGDDVKKSGELGKMYGVGVSSGEHSHPTVATHKPPSRRPSGSARSGTLGPKPTNSGPVSKLHSSSSFSGPITPIQPTGLITSGPQRTSSSNRRSEQVDNPSVTCSFNKANYGTAVTSIGEEVKIGFRVSRLAMWVFLVVGVMGLVVGAFLMAAVKKPVILVVVVAVLVPAVIVAVWNYSCKEQGLLGFLRKYPDAALSDAVDGQFIKVTGVISYALTLGEIL